MQSSKSIYTRPLIKNADTRCSRGCIQNWTKFGQKPPFYQVCECNKSYFNVNTCYSFNTHLLTKQKINFYSNCNEW